MFKNGSLHVINANDLLSTGTKLSRKQERGKKKNERNQASHIQILETAKIRLMIFFKGLNKPF